MARPRHFREATGLVGPRAVADRDAVALLPARTVGDRIVTCWEPTLAEIEEIIETGCIWLVEWGAIHPPVLVSGHKAEVI
jgi:hypothetical protein